MKPKSQKKPPKTRGPSKAFSKVSLKRAVAVARQTHLPLDRITFDAVTGNFSLILGKADDASSKNPWDEVLTDAAHEKRTA